MKILPFHIHRFVRITVCYFGDTVILQKIQFRASTKMYLFKHALIQSIVMRLVHWICESLKTIKISDHQE
jgi:hypothetical protein